MFYTVYKITNLINNKIYVGVHQTRDLNDTYMGSGISIKQAIKKYGIESFRKEYLAIFDNPDDMFKMESEIVNEEFVNLSGTYNIKTGGTGSATHSRGMVPVRDSEGCTFNVQKDDPRYLSGELVAISKGLLVVRDKNGKRFKTSVHDPRYVSGELVPVLKGIAILRDNEGNIVKTFKNDPRCISGELTGFFKGRTHTDETKLKISIANKKSSLGKGNSQYGTVWIHNHVLKINKKVQSQEIEEWINMGWTKGRKIKGYQ